MKESTFKAKVQKIGRIAIPLVIRESLDIHEGDIVDVTVRKEVK